MDNQGYNNDNVVYKVTNGDSTFECLSSYFGKLQIDDLINEDVDSFIELVECKDKILMTVFVNQKLIPYLDKYSYGNYSYRCGAPKEVFREILVMDGKLDARGCVASRALPNNLRVCITSLKDKILKMNPGLKSINFIDLSGNGLLSGDMIHIYDLIVTLDLHNYLSDNNVILSLEGNRIHGIGEYRDPVDRFVSKLTDITNIKYLIMCNNPFATKDRIDFFKTITTNTNSTTNSTTNNNIIEKLIWLENYNYTNTNLWGFMLKSMDICEITKKVHQEFYTNFN